MVQIWEERKMLDLFGIANNEINEKVDTKEAIREMMAGCTKGIFDGFDLKLIERDKRIEELENKVEELENELEKVCDKKGSFQDAVEKFKEELCFKDKKEKGRKGK